MITQVRKAFPILPTKVECKSDDIRIYYERKEKKQRKAKNLGCSRPWGNVCLVDPLTAFSFFLYDGSASFLFLIPFGLSLRLLQWGIYNLFRVI